MAYLRVAVLMIVAASAFLPYGREQNETCPDNPKTQLELNKCANEEAKRADAELDALYRELLSQPENDSVAVAKIEALRKAWVAYRDAYIEARYPAEDKQAAYGTIYPMEVALLRADLTRKHIADVRDLLQSMRF